MHHVCTLMAPKTTERVAAVAAALGPDVAFVDVHTLENVRGESGDPIKREFAYTMHPILIGACIVWNALASAEPRLHTDYATGGECDERVRNKTREGSKRQRGLLAQLQWGPSGHPKPNASRPVRHRSPVVT